MDIVTPGICQVCGKPMNRSIPLAMRCGCKGGIKVGNRLIPMPRGGFTIRNGKVKGVSLVKRMEQRRAREFLDAQRKQREG